jgi:uncharacterized protein with PIN domain
LSAATFTFAPGLDLFLPREQRGATILHQYARAASMKQAIEALGVPHTEIGHIVVNGAAATLDRTVREHDEVEVFAHAPGAAPFETPLAFVADAHLGGLGRMLRMLGFDTIYDNALHDPQIADIASIERRVVLTRDRELLKRRDVMRGAFVRALKPEKQLAEMAQRYPLAEHMKPFALCLHCNLPLQPADPSAVAAKVPERIQAQYRQFMHCPGCARIYWEGSHWDRMRSVLAQALGIDAVA